jgi:methionyl-tRNA synthetase
MGRYARLRGREVHLSTGSDEHGQKIEQKARARGISTQALADEVSDSFRVAWRSLGIEHDSFARTTDPAHAVRVQELWRRCKAAGDIYLGTYEGWYCVADEAFYAEREVVDGLAPSGRPCQRVREPSWFFRLSRFRDALLRHYDACPEFILPESRRNEVVRFVEGGLSDLSVSRTSIRWGVPVPDDPDHVVYVWFDALASYLNPAWGDDTDVVHLVGKDILRFHAVYWPAFLLSAKLRLPDKVFAHGWLTVDGKKITKTAGHHLPPEPLAEAVGADTLRFYLLRDTALGQDGGFSFEALFARQRDLANGLGNLLHRFTKTIVPRCFDGRIPGFVAPEPADLRLARLTEEAARAAGDHFERLAPHRALEAIWGLVTQTNRYVDDTAPWALAKDPARRDRLATVTFAALETLRVLSVLLAPVLPRACDALRGQLGLTLLRARPGVDAWPVAFGELSPGASITPGPPLFPRIDDAGARAIIARLDGQAGVSLESGAHAHSTSPASRP